MPTRKSGSRYMTVAKVARRATCAAVGTYVKTQQITYEIKPCEGG